MNPRIKNLLKFLSVASMMVLVIAVGVFGFIYFEDLTLREAFHLTISTITTVGYGDIVPRTDDGRLFSDFLMIFGVGVVLYSVGIVAEAVVGGRMKKILGKMDQEMKIKSMKDVVIVCGYGRVGKTAVEELMTRKKNIAVVEIEEKRVEDLPKAVPYIIGDATKEDILKKAGLEKAATIITTFACDADTILAMVTARSLKPEVKLIVRALNSEVMDKFYIVGASSVHLPEEEGGKAMAKAALNLLGPTPNSESG